jgi:hypothetical protein
MRIIQICVLVMAANLMVPMIAIHFMDVDSDDMVCELIEDFGEEEEEDGESMKDAEDSIFFREWRSNQALSAMVASVSESSYSENSGFIHSVAIEVQTPPPRIS